ncbi:MAG: GapR family DNA-binding domain-containing protein, partial [Pseudomonadota bacterium]
MAKPRQPKSHDAGAELRAFVERLEKLADEKAEVAEAEKEVKAEIKARGYSVKVLQAIMKRRAMGPDKVREFDELLDLYEVRMGCAVEEAPEKRHAYLRGMADASDRKRITDNPYTANDPRRTAWERGWYEQAGMVEKV